MREEEQKRCATKTETDCECVFCTLYCIVLLLYAGKLNLLALEHKYYNKNKKIKWINLENEDEYASHKHTEHRSDLLKSQSVKHVL